MKEIRCPHCDWLNLKIGQEGLEIKDRKFYLKIEGAPLKITILNCRRCGLPFNPD